MRNGVKNTGKPTIKAENILSTPDLDITDMINKNTINQSSTEPMYNKEKTKQDFKDLLENKYEVGLNIESNFTELMEKRRKSRTIITRDDGLSI